MPASEPTPDAVAMRGITKRFPGVLANDRVDFTSRRGEVHALLGENGAGKSTLMNVLCGLYRPDAGSIHIDGSPVRLRSPRDAIERGIGMVHQHFMLVAAQTVAENIVLGMKRPRFFLDKRRIAGQVAELGERNGLPVDPNRPVWQLSVGEAQRVEILKALHRGARTLVLDEPTAVLTPREVDDLFHALRGMVSRGTSVVIISHKLGEVLDIADRVTVLRRGAVVTSGVAAEGMTQNQLAHMMVGRGMEAPVGARDRSPPSGKTVLEVENLHVTDDRGLSAVRGVTLALRAGEIYGLAGVSGNGQRELIEAIAGLRPVERGKVLFEGRDVTGASPRALHRLGVSYVPEDRSSTGSAGGLSVTENLMLKSSRDVEAGSRWMIDRGKMRARAEALVRAFDIAAPSVDIAAGKLSGGNLQKVILARETDGEAKLLLAAQPTRGLDVGAASNVHDVLLGQRDRGATTLLVSEDLDELLALSDRVGVLFRGEIVGEVQGDEAHIGIVGELMAGGRRDAGSEEAG